MKKTKFIILLSVAVIFVLLILQVMNSSSEPGKFDDLAKCLTENNVKMFGAYWCPHCAEQKAKFGKSFEFINYVECSLPNKAGQTAVCREENIQSYPTWEFADESRITGSLSIDELARLGGCSIR